MARKTDIRLRRSNVANTPPGSADLNLGELAINTMDGALYFKKSDGTIITGHDNTIMHIDSTNDRVGIRTTSPAGPLHVDGHTSSLATILEGNGNGDTVPLHFRVKANNNNVTSHGIFGNAGSTGAGNFIQIGASNTSGISVMSDGKVGIGTTAPTTNNLLHIKKAGFTRAAIEATGNNQSGLKIIRSSSDYDTNWEIYSPSNSTSLRFYGGGDRVTLLTNGNVGIGNTNPNKPLTITADSGANGMALRARSADDYSFIQFFNNAGTALRGQIYSKAAGDIGFTTGTDSSAGNDLYIKNGTGLGIGTDAPANKLHVKAGASGATTFDSRYNLTLEDDGENYIGIYSPSNSFGGVRFINAASSIRGYIDYYHGSQGDKMQIYAQNEIEFNFPSVGEQVTFKSGGSSDPIKVGIGTSSPSRKLHVAGSGGTVAVKVEATDGYQASLDLSNSEGDFRIINDGGTLQFYDDADSAERMRIDTNGSVCIASTSDSGSNRHFFQHDGFFRHVRSGQIVGVFDRLSTDGNIVHFRKDGTDIGTIGTNSGYLVIGSPVGTDAHLLIGNGLIHPATSTGSGKDAAIDIGAATNRFKDLYLSGTAYSTTYKVTGNGNGYAFDASGSSASVANMYCPAGYTLAFGTNNAERMRITNLGTVLVGKTAEGTATDGIELNRQDVIVATRNNDSPLILNRRTSDGDIAVFRKDNTVVGSIAAYSSAIQVGQGNVFLKFANATDTITPANGNGTNNDNAIDLGSSSVRFKDLHLSGNAYIGSSAFAQYFGNSSDTNTLIQFAGSDDIRFRAGGTEKMRINATGVGIGVTSPSSIFDIRGTGNVDVMSKIINTGQTSNGRKTEFLFGKDNGANLSGVLKYVYNTTQASRRIDLVHYGTTNGISITDGGNVGIGQSNPYFPLHVQGPTGFNGDAKNNILAFDTASATTGTGGGIGFGGYTNGTGGDLYHFGNIQGIKENSTAGNKAAAMIFSTRTDGTTPLEQMRISSTGNVGIGTSSPNSYTNQKALTINGTTHSRIDFETGGTLRGNIHADSGSLNIDAGGNYIRFFTGNTEKMRLKSNGFLGIGTQSPLDLLHLKSTSTDARQVIDGHTGFDAELKFAENGSVEYTIGHDAATSKFVIGTVNVDTSKRFTINSSGAITFNEAFTFPTSIGSVGQVLKVPSSGTDLIWGSVSGGSGGSSIEDNDGDTKIQVEESADEDIIRFDIAGTEQMQLNSTGLTVAGNLTVNGTQTVLNTTTLDVEDLNITVNKGGTTSAGADGAGLTIEGPTNNASLIWDHGNQYLEFNKDVFTPAGFIIGTTGTKVGRMYNSSGVMALEAYTSRQISFGNATNGEHVRINAAGYVGIGTASPSYQLHVAGGGDLLVEDTGGGSAHIRLMSTGSGTTTSHYKFKTNAANTFFIDNDTQGTSALTILANGKLGIGSSAPATKLEVKSGGSDDGIQVISSGSTNILGGLIQTGTGDGALVVRNTSNAQTVLFRGQGNNYITGGNMGIGTAGPTQKLEVHGNIFANVSNGQGLLVTSVSGLVRNNATGVALRTNSTDKLIVASNGGVSIGTSTATGSGGLLVSNDIKTESRFGVGSGGNLSDAAIYKNSDTNTGIIWPAADTLGFTTGGVERARVDGSNFDIESGGFRVNDSGGNYPFAVNQHGFMTTRGSSIAQLNATGDHGNVPLSVLADVASTRTASYVEIGDIGSAGNKFIIKSTGNVGIGTNSPNAFLSVRKDNNNSGNQFVVADTEGTSPGVRTYTHGGDDSGLILNHYYALGGSGNEYMRYADFVANVGNGAGTTMRFITKNAANTFSVGLAQDNNGNVGIGTTSIDEKLQVENGNIKIEGGANNTARELIFAHTGYTGNQTILEQRMPGGPYGRLHTTERKLIIEAGSGGGTGANERLEFWTNGSRAVAIDTSQKVGIGGMTNPSNTLTVKSSGNDNGILLQGSGGGSIAWIHQQSTDAATLRLYDGSNLNVLIGSNANSDSYFNTGGNVGIGTNTPSELLEVRKDSSNAIIKVQTGGGNDARLILDAPAAGGAQSQIFFDASGTTAGSIQYTHNSGGTNFMTFHTGGSNVERMRIDSSGRLLIGTTSSLHGSADLQIQGASGNYARIMLKDQDGTSQHAFIDESTGNISITSQNGTAHGTISLKQYDGTNTLTRLHINDAGNIGIGVTSIPSWANVMTNGTVAVGGILYIKQDQKIQALTAFPGGAGYLRINPDGGNVGIGMGSATPKAKFQVEELGIDTTNTTTSATTQVTLASLSITDFRSARFTIQISNTTDSTYHTTEILAVHDGSTANITEFGEVHTGSSVEATFDAVVTSGFFRLQATPTSTNNMVFKVVSYAITV